MNQALILCAGQARRLHPYSHITPKACMPFLNLPLMSLSLLYLEQLGVSQFLFNSHLFPEILQKQVAYLLNQATQKTSFIFEQKPLGAAGTLYHAKQQLQQQDIFFYINGDTLFFPSKLDQLQNFKQQFFLKKADVLFFGSPKLKPLKNTRTLWCDAQGCLQFVGTVEELQLKYKSFYKTLTPVAFSGLAMFKSDVLNMLNENDQDLFTDFINKLLGKKQIFVFLDKGARLLQADSRNSYLESTKICMQSLFFDKISEIKKIILHLFHRFDSADHIVGYQNGLLWSKTLQQAILAPKSVKGLEHILLNGYAILGSYVKICKHASLTNVVIDQKISWSGELKNDILLRS